RHGGDLLLAHLPPVPLANEAAAELPLQALLDILDRYATGTRDPHHGECFPDPEGTTRCARKDLLGFIGSCSDLSELTPAPPPEQWFSRETAAAQRGTWQ